MDQEQMTLEDWLDDLCVRFIINLPQEDLMSVARICFQVEEAHWFYEDFIRALNPALPHMTLRDFCLRMFQHCPLLASFGEDNHLRAYQEFMQYKTRIPVRGAIMLNDEMDSTVLVRGWKSGASWSFPRGKINKDEDDLDCAIREVYEETGFDLHEAGLVSEDRDVKFIEVTMRDQHMRLYVFRDVPMDTVFEPRTRNEIGKISWYNLQDLPAFRKKKGLGRNEGIGADAIPNANKFYMVAPFLVPLKKWVVQQKKRDIQMAARHAGHVPPSVLQDDIFAQEDEFEGSPPAAAPNGNHGAALLSMLQSKATASNSELADRSHYPHTPVERTLTEASQPHTPHHHRQPAHHLAQPGYDYPPHFPVAPDSHMGHHPQHHPLQQGNLQQFQPWPQVHLATGASEQPGILVSPRQPQTQPQLLHPQPQPPQVQQFLLMRDMVGTPGAEQKLPPGPPRSNQNFNQKYQPNPPAIQGIPGARIQAPPSDHSLGLLNMFKGAAQPSPPQQANQSRALPPIDKHRSGLLGMFKQEDALKFDKFLDQNVPPAQAQPIEKPFSAAETFRAAAEDGRPLVMNPELNLPFGALSIASRPKPSPKPTSSKLNTVEIGAMSPRQTSNQPSPQLPRYPLPQLQMRPSKQLFSQSPNSLPQKPSKSMGYPYGNLNKDTSASSLSNSRAPDASTLPMPNILKPRQESSAEQKNPLLGLFRPSSNKGKEPEIPRPRSRVASIASAGIGSGGSASRRDSQTPLTQDDQKFLMNLLQKAAQH
ncbi:Dcp2, box A domain-containing protein [Xylariales sp. AK1849]|nr:Dcp2, box A domain-containing protein [Xylariales sp. AK1849]